MSSTRIGFSTPRKFNPLSALIRKVTGSKASHAWFVYYDEDFKLEMVMDAHETGFRLIPLNRFSKQNRVVAIVDPQINLDEGLCKAARWLGSAYDFPGLLGTAVVLVGRWFKRKWKNPFRSSRSVFCSEAVARVLRDSKYPGASGLRPEDTTPQDLLVLLSAAPAVKPGPPSVEPG